MKSDTARLPYLDTARGLAAISVITWHCFTAITDHPETTSLYTSPFHFFLYGEADMIFFFIHSGFILSYAHPNFRTEISGSSYIRYLISRIFRIYPLFLFVLSLSFLLKNTIYPIRADQYLSYHFSKFWSTPQSWAEVMKQGLLAIRIPKEPEYRLLPQDWTLSVEVLICPLIPFLNYLNHRIKLLSWVVVLILLKVFHFNTYLFEFAVGVNLFEYRIQIASIWKKCNFLIKFVFFAIAIALYTVLFGYPNIFNKNSLIFSPALDRLMVVGGCTLFFVFILYSRSIQKLFSFPAFIKIGKICYSLYVNHILLLICFSNTVMTVLHHVLKGPSWLTILFFVMIFLLLTILMSLCTYRWIEKPFNKWGKNSGVLLTRFLQQKPH